MYLFTNLESSDFFIQLKGEHAGKPLKNKIPNSIGIRVDRRFLDAQYLFYLVTYLYMAGKFKQYIKGSVIPFITQKDIAKAIFNFQTCKEHLDMVKGGEHAA